MKYDLAIQIINYNTKQYLKNCLEMLLRDLESAKISYIINILENGSEDDLYDIKALFKHDDRINFHFSDVNLGFSGGHNWLAQQCDANFILLVNPDIKFIQPNTIMSLYTFIVSLPDIAAVAPKLLTSELKPLPFDHSPFKGFDSVLDPFIWVNSDKVKEVAIIDAAIILLRKKAFDLVDGFDTKFFMYIEAADLCIRLREKNWRIFYLPDVRVIHDSKLTKDKVKYTKDSMDYFIKKHNKSKLLGKVVRSTINSMPVYEIAKIVVPDYCT